MDQSYPTTADDIFASWLDHLEMQGYLYTLSMGSLSEPGYLPAPGNLLEPGNLPNYNTINDMAFPQASMTSSMGAFTSSLTQQYNTYQDVPGAGSILAQPFPGTSSAVFQAAGEPHWTGVPPLATHTVAATLDGMSPTGSSTPTSADEWSWMSEPGHSTRTTPSLYVGNECEVGSVALPGGHYLQAVHDKLEVVPTAPEYGANPFAVTIPPAEWDTGEIPWLTPAPGNVEANVTAPTVALGKRHREAEEPHGDGGLMEVDAHEMPPQKRARGSSVTDGILKAARSAARTRHKPVARIPRTTVNGKPKEAGRGAERLTTPNVQGIYHQPLPGPSFQQGRADEAPDGQPIWVEGRDEEEAMHHVSNAVQQQQEPEVEEEEENVARFKISRKLKPAHRELLVATEVDLARGVLQDIKCRICPNTPFKTWEDYKRHCDTAEVHPLEISFCDLCGDFFARKDALVRHRKHPPAECKKVTPEEAAAKRRETKRAHVEFVGHLRECLNTGEDIGKTFSQIIKEKYPESAKKRKSDNKERSRRKGR